MSPYAWWALMDLGSMVMGALVITAILWPEVKAAWRQWRVKREIKDIKKPALRLVVAAKKGSVR